jgi:hypothetical protein
MFPPAPPRFEPRRLDRGDGWPAWCVLVTWHDGETDHVDGFTSQTAAERWIEIESANWERVARLVRAHRKNSN